MPEPRIKSQTRNAQVKKQGHTASGKYGTDPQNMGKVKKGSSRDLSLK